MVRTSVATVMAYTLSFKQILHCSADEVRVSWVYAT
jgi:hypothetical protein